MKQDDNNMSPQQGFGLMVTMIALLGIWSICMGVDHNTVTFEQGLYISTALLIIVGAGVLLINHCPNKDNLHKSKKKTPNGWQTKRSCK